MGAQEEYRQRGCTYLAGLLPAEVCASVTYQAQVGQKRPHGPALNRPKISNKETVEVYSYGWPVLLGLHWGLTPAIEAAAGAPLLPSYAYFRSYQRGDVCKVHIDRPSCEHSLSLAIGYSDAAPWALCVGERLWTEEAMRAHPITPDFGEEAFAAFPIGVGDGVLYRGVERRHGRVEPNPNRWSAHLFMHWVERDGPCAQWAFDRQKVAEAGDFRFA